MKPFELHYSRGEAQKVVDDLDRARLQTLQLGVATAGYQCEGGYNRPGEPLNNWWQWEGRPGVASSGGACRFWDRYGEDVEIIKAAGLSTFRFSIEWARVAPCRDVAQRGLSPLDPSAIARYADILESLHRAEIEPVVTLYHWTHPANLGVDLWLSPESPELFSRYAVEMLASLLDQLDQRGVPPPHRFVTLNEPNMIPLNTYLAGRFPHGPGRQGGQTGVRSMQNLLLAHLTVAGGVRALYQARGFPAPALSFNNNFSAFYRADSFFLDLVLAPSRGVAREHLDDHLRQREERFTREFLASEGEISPLRQAARWGFRGLEALLRQGVTTQRFGPLVDAVYAFEGSPLDYLSFDYYDPFPWNVLGRSTPGSDRGPSPIVDEWDWRPHPRGFSVALELVAGAAPLPVWVMENGMATRAVGRKGFPRRDGARRDLFIRAHLMELLRAMAGGVRVEGYLHWSLWDNFEWGSFQPRFGLIGLDAAGGDVERRSLDAAGVPSLAVLGAIGRLVRSCDRATLVDELSNRGIGPVRSPS